MKKIVLIIISFVFMSISAFSQFSLVPYLPDEKIEDAREAAAAVEGFTNPELVAIVTMNGPLPGSEELMGAPIDVAFITEEGDDKGKSSGWLFFFASDAVPDDIEGFVVADLGVLGLQVLRMKDLSLAPGEYVEYVSINNLDDGTWLNSDEMVNYLLASTQYQDFMTANADGKPDLITIGYLDYEYLSPDTPYWFIFMKAEADSNLIIINALDGTVTGVEEDFSIFDGQIMIFPNPALDYAIVEIPAIMKNSDLIIYDGNGKEIRKIGNNRNNETIRVDLTDFSNGNYFISISNKNHQKMQPLIIIK